MSFVKAAADGDRPSNWVYILRTGAILGREVAESGNESIAAFMERRSCTRKLA
jgi:hypothetical protein